MADSPCRRPLCQPAAFVLSHLPIDLLPLEDAAWSKAFAALRPTLNANFISVIIIGRVRP